MISHKEGTTIGPYRLMGRIGMGGMAAVYKAYQPNMERYVALKILPERYAEDPRFVERFIREARTIAQLEHTNILPVYDFGEDHGVTYLAMRYLEGGTLKDIMAQGRLSLKEIGNLISPICAALDYAHRRGVVHRDVKPANILIDTEGSPYLMDFGIAKVLEGASPLTETGAAIGTPAYMAPEQSLGQTVDARTDVYALGIILFEMVVGRVPFQADTPMAVALAHIHEPLPLPRTIDPRIPQPVEEIIIKALAKNPDDRYQSAVQLAQAFHQAILAGDQVGDSGNTLQVLLTAAQTSAARGTQAPGAPRTRPAPQKRSSAWLRMLLFGALSLIVIMGLAFASRSLGIIGGGQGIETPAQTVVVRFDPRCSMPAVTSADNIVVRAGWAEPTAEAAEQGADNLTFAVVLDGNTLEIEPKRLPVQTPNDDRYGCGWAASDYRVYFDFELGPLEPGTHVVSIEFLSNQGSWPESVGTLEKTFEVLEP